MANEQLAAYVRQQLAAGVPKENIQQALATQGWSAADINAAFVAEQPLAQTPLASQPQPVSKDAVGIGKRIASGFGYLLSFYIAYSALTSVFVLATTAAYFVYQWENFPFTSVIGLERIAAFIIGILLAWMTGRHFGWILFRKYARERKPHGHISRVWFPVLCGFFVILFILSITPSVLGIFYKDIPPIDDSDLQMPTLSVPDSQNALTDLTAAGDKISSSYDGQKLQAILDGASWDAAFAAQAISTNASALQLYETAATKQTFQDPAAATPDTLTVAATLPSLGSIRTLDKLNDLTALALAHQNKGTEALQTALAGVVVGHKIEESQGFLIEYLVGVAVKEQALETANLILATSSISSSDLKSFAAALGQYTDDGAGLVKANKVNYYTQKSTIEDIAHGGASATGAGVGDLTALSSQINSFFYYHPNQSISYLANDIRQRIAAAQAPCNDLQQHDVAKLLPASPWLWYFTPNAIGKLLHDVTAASLDTANVKRCQENTLLGAVQLSAAIKAYKQDKGQLPPSLDALVPDYLATLPNDPFSGQSFKYDPTKQVIYSIGPSKKDLGGSTGSSWDQMDNPTFSIAF